MLTQVQLLGAPPPPLKIWEGKKRAKIGAIYDNFRVWAQISLEAIEIATKSKRRWRARSFVRWTKKIMWNSVHYEQSYKRSCWSTLSRQCAFGVYQCIWVRAAWLWCRGNFTPPPNFPQSDLGRWADSRWALPQISSSFSFPYLEVEPLKSSQVAWGSAVSSPLPRTVSKAEPQPKSTLVQNIFKIWYLATKNLLFFPENQLTKFSAL